MVVGVRHWRGAGSAAVGHVGELAERVVLVGDHCPVGLGGGIGLAAVSAAVGVPEGLGCLALSLFGVDSGLVVVAPRGGVAVTVLVFGLPVIQVVVALLGVSVGAVHLAEHVVGVVHVAGGVAVAILGPQAVAIGVVGVNIDGTGVVGGVEVIEPTRPGPGGSRDVEPSASVRFESNVGSAELEDPVDMDAPPASGSSDFVLR